MSATISVVDRALGALDRLSPPPPVISSVLVEASGADVSFSRLTRLIEKDNILTAAFLQRANSAIFRGQSSIHSVRQSLTRMGLDEIRSFVLSLSSNSLCSRAKLPPAFSRKRYARHASTTAVMTGLIERQLGNPHGSHADLAALLHDVSRLLVAMALPEEFSAITERGQWDEARETECLGMNHGELSAIVLRAWKMPPEVVDAVEGHHVAQPSDLHPNLAAILHAADNFTAAVADPDEPETAVREAHLLQGVGIDAAIPSLLVDFRLQLGRSGA
jgi:putative nucleotidyltransferase with HDIG domain